MPSNAPKSVYAQWTQAGSSTPLSSGWYSSNWGLAPTSMDHTHPLYYFIAQATKGHSALIVSKPVMSYLGPYMDGSYLSFTSTYGQPVLLEIVAFDIPDWFMVGADSPVPVYTFTSATTSSSTGNAYYTPFTNSTASATFTVAYNSNGTYTIKNNPTNQVKKATKKGRQTR